MARDNGLCACVVKPHGVSDKPLGEAILHGSEASEIGRDPAFPTRLEGGRMTAGFLFSDGGSSGGVFEEHFTMTAVALPLGIHAQACASTETWGLARDKQRHPTPQKANTQGHLLPKLRI